ncbi:MAG: hypothetical protein WCL50_00300 [Spirochaetota bacterium]
MKRLFSIIAFAVICLASILAGPFGLDMGMTLDQIRDATGHDVVPSENSPNLYYAIPAKGHPAFDSYLVQVSPKTGLYYIKAIGKDISTNRYGLSIQTAFDNLKASIEKAYGPSKSEDLLMSKSIWNEPRDWMMGLLKKERYLDADWDKKDGANLPENLASIFLMAHASSTEEGWIGLEYYFSNYEEAKAEIKASTDSVF